ncbi:MAG: Uncharacterised protein [Flavobacteriaceae bacterium]|nr:MAG: Uncharacterised protein [Flavobacteriaceae bacterium]
MLYDINTNQYILNMDKNNLVTVQDLQKMKEEIISEIALITEKTTTQKEWLRSAEVMKMLTLSTGTLQNHRINGKIPYTRIGGTLYYERKAILKVLNDNKRAA